MKIIVSGRNIHLTEAIKNYVNEKFDRLEHHFDFIHEVHVFLSVHKNPRISANQIAEATVHVNGAVVRVEESSPDLYASIDSLVDKVDRSLQKHKTKLLHRAKRGRGESIRRLEAEEAAATAEAPEGLEEDLDQIFYTYSE